jgi:predicted PurR-regulated permease PerM
MLWLQARLWRRRWLAVTAMTLMLLLVLVIPLTVAAGTLAANAQVLAEGLQALADFRLPPPPQWLANLPYVGEPIAQAWLQVAAAGVEGLLAQLKPYAGSAARWLVAHIGVVGLVLLQFMLTLVLATLMYASGEQAASTVLRFGRRLAGERGENAVVLAGLAIRSVALGVIVTAVVQAALGGIGLAIAGVPVAGLLTALMLFLCIAQVGPSPVLFPAVIWLYWSGAPGRGTFLLVWSLVVVTLDNVLRPMLIRRGVDLPLLLIFAGVIGGLLAFGPVGIFVGPVVLAVAYTLFEAWIGDLHTV